MEEIFVALFVLIALVFSVLSIILFFKVWRMTNDVHMLLEGISKWYLEYHKKEKVTKNN